MSDHLLRVLPRFLLACLVLAALPGPASVLCLHRTLRDGRTAGLAAVAGNEIGVFGWAIAGGAGLSVLLAANRVLSDALHVVGGLALVVLGLQAWRGARRAGADEFGVALTGRLPRGRTPGAAFRASLVSIAANPKAAAFALMVPGRSGASGDGWSGWVDGAAVTAPSSSWRCSSRIPRRPPRWRCCGPPHRSSACCPLPSCARAATSC